MPPALHSTNCHPSDVRRAGEGGAIAIVAACVKNLSLSLSTSRRRCKRKRTLVILYLGGGGGGRITKEGKVPCHPSPPPRPILFGPPARGEQRSRGFKRV